MQKHQSPSRGISSDTFEVHGRRMLMQAPGLSTLVGSRRFRGLFGVSSAVCALAWNAIGQARPKKARPKHLLWALVFLKCYATEHYNRIICEADEKTLRKWVWVFVRLLSELQVLHWGNRLVSSSPSPYFASVDGTDFRIFEPTPFSPEWYSHKFKGPGLRYEVGICLVTGHIVWAHGPFPCGSYPDVNIFRIAMKGALLPGEKVIADGGYADPTCAKLPAASEALHIEYHALARARHETCNRRFKQFGALGQRFRHSLRHHSQCFHAIANLTQLMIENGFPLFSLNSE